jgi:hypothetical protein
MTPVVATYAFDRPPAGAFNAVAATNVHAIRC